ncbi:hypothetical protein GYMLUDRAFT_49858 [Collybiopsis luxurians FD-317 M1]|uniref:Uncharacterized protein n=1 Tax=Collybiopsis luxurians FD-317 M1 TaxID=944289 RepID=A0A0D0BS66_9AGAR|nr:hypothetical protein GYMLUDRAFT_49858 [Collybiopsis luxurians FD-317 M1]
MSSREDMNSVSNLVQQVFFKVGQIEPPNPGASPRTKSTFNRMLTTVAQAAGQTLDLAVGLSAMADSEDGIPINLGLKVPEWHNFLNVQDRRPQDDMEDIRADEDDGHSGRQERDDDMDEDEDEDEDVDPQDGIEDAQRLTDDEDAGQRARVDDADEVDQVEKAPDARSAKIDELVDMIFAGTEDVGDGIIRYDLQDLRDMILKGGYKGKVVDEEREAFRRMIIGYDVGSLEDLKKVFDEACLGITTVVLTTERALEFAAVKDVPERILKREIFAFRADQQDQVTSYVLNVVRNIEGIRTYDEWDSQSKAFKKNFRRRLAEQLYPQAFHDIETSEDPEKKKSREYTKLVTPVHKKHDKLLSRRKQILFLYQQFGPIVLLEPTFFKTKGIEGYPRQSNNYIKVLDSVLRRVEGQELSVERYTDDRALVLRTVKLLGGDVVEKFVRQFLDEFMYWTLFSDGEDEAE